MHKTILCTTWLLPDLLPLLNFTPEFLKWTHPSLNWETSIVANRVSVKINNKMANSVDPDKMACYKLSHMDLHCLQRFLYWSAGMKGLTEIG